MNTCRERARFRHRERCGAARGRRTGLRGYTRGRPGEAATRDGVVKAVEAAIAGTGKDDLLLIAFFGRGASTGDKTVYFTPNTVLKDRAKTALVLGSDLAPAFKKVKGQNVKGRQR